ncbi:MAG: efflux RND transporter periplasmic adaptor subunit [Rhodospirillaceae bacterium]|nr:efflux RND transporter periplasmic adaptor subunit [Rhodospirillaceae bacterium]
MQAQTSRPTPSPALPTASRPDPWSPHTARAARRLGAETRSFGLHLAVVGLVVMASAIMLTGCDGQAQPTAEIVRPVKTATVSYATVVDRVVLPGTVQPRHAIDMAFRVGGKVSARYVDIGASVHPGQTLAVLEPQDLDLQLQAARAQKTAADADYIQAKADFERYEQLKTSAAFNQAMYDRRAAALNTAAARVREAQSKLDLARNEQGYGTLEASDFGVVTDVSFEAGQVVSAGQKVITIARSGDLEVLVNVPEHRLDALNELPATVTLWSHPGEMLTARLREVSPIADKVTRTYAARFTLDDLPAGIEIGMSATLTLASPAKTPLAEVPLAAVVQTGDAPSVWVIEPGTGALTRVPTTIAAYRNDAALISAGPAEGALIVAAGGHKLDESQRVRVMGVPRI